MMENTTTIISENVLWEYKNSSYADEWFLVGSTSKVLLILTTYLAFVLKVGPYLMKERTPFKLTNIILAYNAFQVLISAYIFKMVIEILYNGAVSKQSCIDNSSELQYKYFYALHIYLLVKLSELLDTVFFVLRKQDRQISFLHVYHHSAVFFYTWVMMTFKMAFFSVAVIGLLNSFVHLIMYSYYALSIFPSISKYLWWKKYITKMQMIQFAMILAYVTYEYNVSTCRVPGPMFAHVVGNITLMFILFANFYRKTYKSPQQKMK